MKAKSRQRKQAGFSLVEVLIVIIVLGILAGVAMLSAPGFIEQGRRTKAATEAAALANAINIYNTTRGTPMKGNPDGTVIWATPNPTPIELEKLLSDARLLPKLSPALFDDALVNVIYLGDATSFFGAKEAASVDLRGY